LFTPRANTTILTKLAVTAAAEVTLDGDEPPEAASDEALIRRVRRGDPDALETLLRRYVRPVHAVAASFLSEPADVEDAAQEAFLRALRAIESYDPKHPFAPWLYQIARNVARNRVAAGHRWQSQPLSEDMPSPHPGPDVALERAEIRERVDAAIARLPERRRVAFRLSDVEGYGTDEVAQMMGLEPGTVRTHVHHARSALRAALAGIREQPEKARG
jgi:RNA polymerase sigma-70 factor (ECF subfamily)